MNERERLDDVYRSYTSAGFAGGKWERRNPGNRMILTERVDAARLLLGAVVDDRAARVLDLGAGSDVSFPGLFLSGTEIRLDLLIRRLEEARLHEPDSKLVCGDGAQLPFSDHSFDVVVVSTVLTSVVDPSLRQRIIDEVGRVVALDGRVLWYDFRYPSPGNRNVSPVTTRELSRLFAGWTIDRVTVTVLPPLARRLPARCCKPLYRALRRVPMLRSHVLAVVQPPARTRGATP